MDAGRQGTAVIPVPAISLEDLVPLDHFYRHLEQALVTCSPDGVHTDLECTVADV
jgi:hypothetical protein